MVFSILTHYAIGLPTSLRGLWVACLLHHREKYPAWYETRGVCPTERQVRSELCCPLQPTTYLPQESNLGSQAYTWKSPAFPSSPGTSGSALLLNACELYLGEVYLVWPIRLSPFIQSYGRFCCEQKKHTRLITRSTNSIKQQVFKVPMYFLIADAGS